MKRACSIILILVLISIVFLSAYSILQTDYKLISATGAFSRGITVHSMYSGDEAATTDRQEEAPSVQTDRESKPAEQSHGTASSKPQQKKLRIIQSVQETSYYCVPACIQMTLRYHAIECTQHSLAQQLHTDPVTGTEYVDMASVLNSYLFPDTSMPSADEAGYHVQTIAPTDHTQEISEIFSRRCEQNIKDGYPVFAAVDLHALYPTLAHANHMVLVIGYAKNDETITSYYIIDPYPPVQDDVYKGLKIFSAEELVHAMLVNEEPAYIW